MAAFLYIRYIVSMMINLCLSVDNPEFPFEKRDDGDIFK